MPAQDAAVHAELPHACRQQLLLWAVPLPSFGPLLVVSTIHVVHEWHSNKDAYRAHWGHRDIEALCSDEEDTPLSPPSCTCWTPCLTALCLSAIRWGALENPGSYWALRQKIWNSASFQASYHRFFLFQIHLYRASISSFHRHCERMSETTIWFLSPYGASLVWWWWA